MTAVKDFTAILAVLNGNGNLRWNAPEKKKLPVVVTYSFLEAGELPPVSSLSYKATSVESFSTAFRDGFRDAAAEFEKVTGVLFVETDGPAMISAYGVRGSNWGGWASYPWASAYGTGSGILVLDLNSTSRAGAVSGFGFEAFLHELGHAMGLSHPHDGAFTLTSDLDDNANTVMSYSRSVHYRTDLAPMDVEALQYLYGGPQDVTGWTYGFDKAVFTLKASARDDTVVGVAGRNVLKGGKGDDTIIGRDQRDVLTGGKGDDLLIGGSGRDTIRAGGGDDRLFAGNTDRSDYYKNTLKGGAGRDTLFGADGSDVLRGGPGNDRLFANRRGEPDYSDNTLSGGNGADRLTGDRGSDRLLGGKGNDKLFGGDGGDTLKGGAGRDILVGGDSWHGDTFVFSRADSGARDVIRDFQLGTDTVRFLGGLDTGAASVRPANGGTNAVLSVEEVSVKFLGVSAQDLRDHVDDPLALFFV